MRSAGESYVLMIILLFVEGMCEVNSPGTREIIQMFSTAGIYPLLTFCSLSVHNGEMWKAERDQNDRNPEFYPGSCRYFVCTSTSCAPETFQVPLIYHTYTDEGCM